MATRLAIRKKQLETWTAIIQECRNSGMKTKDWLAENNISEKPQIVKLECADYQNNLDSCSNSRIRINHGSIHIEIDGGAAPAVIRSIMEVLVDAE